MYMVSRQKRILYDGALHLNICLNIMCTALVTLFRTQMSWRTRFRFFLTNKISCDDLI